MVKHTGILDLNPHIIKAGSEHITVMENVLAGEWEVIKKIPHGSVIRELPDEPFFVVQIEGESWLIKRL